MEWTFEGLPVTDHNYFYGFVYLITNLITGKSISEESISGNDLKGNTQNPIGVIITAVLNSWMKIF